MRHPNLTRMRKVNMATIYEAFPPRYVLGLPVDGEIPDFPVDRMWTLPDRDVTLERRPKSVTRWTMRRAEVER